MFEEIAITARSSIAIGTCFYMGAFLLSVYALRKPYLRLVAFALLSTGFLFHTLGLSLRGGVVKGCPLGNSFEVSQFILWSLVLLYFVVGKAFGLRLLGLFTAGLVSVLSLVSLLMPGWDAPYALDTMQRNPWIELHASLAVFSYAIFAIVALVSAMFLIQQHGLKKKHSSGLYHYLPSIQKLDAMAKQLLVSGVSVLSAALAFGALFWISHPERVPIFKLTATCLLWAGYFTMIVLRIKRQLVTRRHAIASIVLFVLAIASLWPVQSARNEYNQAPVDSGENNAPLNEQIPE